MVNRKGGKKHKRNKAQGQLTKVLHHKEEGQEYAQVIGAKGNCRFDLKVFDGKQRLGILCGAMRKREFINARDVVLVSLRDFQDDKCDIIGLYDENQVRKLKELNEIPSNINLNEDNEFSGLDEEDPFAVGSSSEEETDDSLDLDEI